jgi:hypothetical protein
MSQTTGDLQQVVGRLLNRQGTSAFDEGAKIIPFHILKRDEVEILVLTAIEDTSDIIVIEASRRPSLVLKAKAMLLVLGHLGGEDLDGDTPIQNRVSGEHDGGHATHPEGMFQLEMGQPHAGQVGDKFRPFGILRSRFAGDYGRSVVVVP